MRLMQLMIRAAFFIDSLASYIFFAPPAAIPLPIDQGGGEGIELASRCFSWVVSCWGLMVEFCSSDLSNLHSILLCGIIGA